MFLRLLYGTGVLLLNLLAMETVLLVVGLITAGIPLFIGITFLTIGIKTVRGTVASLRTNAPARHARTGPAPVLRYLGD